MFNAYLGEFGINYAKFAKKLENIGQLKFFYKSF